MSVDWTKPVQTKDGLPVRVLATDRKGFKGLEIVVLVNENGREVLAACAHDGTGIVQNDPGWHIVNA